MDLPSDRDSVFIYGFCRGLNADHKVTQAEEKAFIELLRDNPALLKAKILDSHRDILEKLSREVEIWRIHCEQADSIIFSILGVSKLQQDLIGIPALQYDSPEPATVDFSNANIVFTGEFHMGRSHAEELGLTLGANLQG